MLSSCSEVVRNPCSTVALAPLNYLRVLNDIRPVLELRDFFDMQYIKTEKPERYSYVRAKVVIKQETSFVLQVLGVSPIPWHVLLVAP